LESAGIQQTVIGDHNIFTGTGDIRITYQLPPAESEERRLLLQLTESVRRFWIAGVLERSVHEAALVALRKEARPEAVQHPWGRVLALPRQAEETLGAERKIGDIFAQTGRTLLVLGEPGAGKTVTLLELARDLIERFEKDPTQSAPVVLNLSTWAGGSLAAWVEAEMKSKYFIPPKRTRAWLQHSRLIPLLDGLDEIAADRRAACLAAINQFLESGGVPGISVCCRLAEYLALPERLHFTGAVCLQPLDEKQIEEFLARGGTQFFALRTVIRDDPLLREMARSPLMLNVICLAYAEQPLDVVAKQQGDTPAMRRAHLFEEYVAAMFERVAVGASGFSRKCTQHWLHWLAEKMRAHSLTIFLIESLQPSWLPSDGWRTAYALLSRTLVCLVWILVWWLATLAITPESRRFFLPGNVMTVFVSVIAGGLAGVMAVWRMRSPPATPRAERWRVAIEVLAHPLVMAPAVVAISGPFYFDLWRFLMAIGPGSVLDDRAISWMTGVRYGILFGIIFGLKSYRRSAGRDIHLVGAFRLSFAQAWRGAKWGTFGGFVAWGTVLALLMIASWQRLAASVHLQPTGGTGIFIGFCAWFLLALISALLTGIVGALFGLLAPSDRPPTGRPGRGLWQATANSLLAGIGVFVVFALVSAGIGVASHFPHYWPEAFRVAAGYGITAAIWYGGQDALQHLTLRILLRLHGGIPKNFVRFLDHATRLIFLQKVGSGYIFVHRQLLDFFADLKTDLAQKSRE
jgi:DNA polymerase III delta prime subunit